MSKVLISNVKGPEGKSAYELAIEEGFEGTQQEWLDSLNGDVTPEAAAARDAAITAASEAESASTQAASHAAAVQAVTATNDGIMTAVAADPESEFAIQQKNTIAEGANVVLSERETRATAGVGGATASHPVFVATGETAWTQAAGPLDSLYWPTVLDTGPSSAYPARYGFAYSTDHASEDPGDASGIAVGWSDDPTVVGSDIFSKITISGLPAGLVSIETPTFNLFPGIGLFLTFQAMDTNAGNSQDSHLATTADGLTWTYARKVTPFPLNLPGDGHGGYLGPHLEWGNAYASWSLAGGTNTGHAGLRVTRDFVDWAPVKHSPSALGTDGLLTSRISFRPFRWRGTNWVSFSRTTGTSGGGTAATVKFYVAQIAPDYATLLSEPVELSLSGKLEGVVAHKGELIGFYRDGGRTGSSIKFARAEG